MDEARIQAGVQSSNWIWASWATVASNSTFENYSTVAQQTPALTIGIGGTSGTIISWPGAGVGFALYASTNLASSGIWTLAANQPVLTNGQWQINLSAATNAVQFYRLKSQ